MTRRGHGEGSAPRLRKDGRWVAEVSMGFDGTKRIRRSFYGATRREVVEKMKAALREQQQGVLAAGRVPTVGEYLTRWLDGIELRPSTRRRYTDIVRLHLVPALGRLRLERLGHHDVNAMLRAKVEGGLAPRTANHLRAVLRAALNDAAKDGLVARNAAALADPRKVEEKPIRVPSPAGLPALLAAISAGPLGPLFAVTLMLGLRQGEVLGLRWSDIDFEAGTISVTGALQRVDGRLRRVDTKTRESRRTLVMNDLVRTTLVAHRQRQMAILASAWGDPDGYVFTTQRGTPLDGTYTTHALQRVLAGAGLPRMRFHDLRHCTASLLAAAGASPKVVQRQLGHGDVTTTLRVYVQVTDDAMREAAALMGRMASATVSPA